MITKYTWASDHGLVSGGYSFRVRNALAQFTNIKFVKNWLKKISIFLPKKGINK